MASETESNAPSSHLSEIADLSIGSEGAVSQAELPEHDELSIQHGGKTYKRGKARPAKRKERSPNAWYWKHGEELSEGKQRRWMCEPCWEAKKFTHFAVTSNRAIIRHLKETHDVNKSN